ncbi:hypothetical protein [Photobacterium leiognathi]|uniref:hypothetical protein n=1 Tax=Photobacterium leiognathi TaxID=553611 RepID=UPI0029818620|nr:hypothetical protein [Photobacterium leiognathi]
MKKTDNNSISNHILRDRTLDWTDDDVTDLMEGMLKSALLDIADGRKSKVMKDEAIEWLIRDDYSSAFSACNCCKALGYDIDLLRTEVNKHTNGALNHDVQT